MLANITKRVTMWRVRLFHPDQLRGIPKTSESLTEAILNAVIRRAATRAPARSAMKGAAP